MSNLIKLKDPIDPKQYPLRALMYDRNIFLIEKDPKEPNLFHVTEACDLYFSVTLTKNQLNELGLELIKLANS